MTASAGHVAHQLTTPIRSPFSEATFQKAFAPRRTALGGSRFVIRMTSVARAKAEADAKSATNEAERQRLEAEAKAKAAELERSLANQQQELAALAPVPVAPRAAGQSAKAVWMHEVTDIWALARVHPGLVKIEPRKAEIAEVINAQAMSGQKPQIAGLRIWEDVAVSVRQGKGRTLDV